MVFSPWVYTICLPKWSQIVITGERVSVDQAKEIIRRTDYFLTGLWPRCGGNNHNWDNWARDVMGISRVIDIARVEINTRRANVSYQSKWETLDALRVNISKRLQWFRPAYVSNNWASTPYVYGPHGWCHPDGTIGFADNIGKWATVESVFEDWEIIAKQFPFLKLIATLYDGELGTSPNPLITFLIENGKVSIHEPEEVMDRFDEFTFEEDRSEDSLIQLFSCSVISGRERSSEQGLPDEWILEFADMTYPVIDKDVKEYLENLGRKSLLLSPINI